MAAMQSLNKFRSPGEAQAKRNNAIDVSVFVDWNTSTDQAAMVRLRCHR
jgi:hypothetical protein